MSVDVSELMLSPFSFRMASVCWSWDLSRVGLTQHGMDLGLQQRSIIALFADTSDVGPSTKNVDIRVLSVPCRPCSTRTLAAGPRDEAGRLLLNRT